MTSNEIKISYFLKYLYSQNINRIVTTKDLMESKFIVEAKKENFKIYNVEDPRTASYISTGMCAELNEPIVLCLNGNLESRSASTGLTEAYYRGLPIVFVTLSDENSVSQNSELNDIFSKKLLLDCNISGYQHKIDELFKYQNNAKMPVHIDFNLRYDLAEEPIYSLNNKDALLADLNDLVKKIKDINKDSFILVSSKISNDDSVYINKYGNEGCIATVLGASLANKEKRCIGVMSETEFLHDINTLGNRHFNKSICLIVISEKPSKLIEDCCTSFDYDYDVCRKSDQLLNELMKKQSKPIVIQLLRG